MTALRDQAGKDTAPVVVVGALTGPKYDGHRPTGFFVTCTHPRFLIDASSPGNLERLIGIQANASSRDVTQLDGATATVADPVSSWAADRQALHEGHDVRILGGCCGTTSEHLEHLAAASGE